MRRILSALMIGVMTVVGGVVGKTAFKKVAPGVITQSARQAAKVTGKAAKSTNVQRGAAATATSGAAASVATQLHDKGGGPDIVDEAEAHEPTYNGPAEQTDREERYRRRDLADTSGL